MIWLSPGFQSNSQQTKSATYMPVKILATKGPDSSKGTGFIVCKNLVYYLVTAKHVFYPTSVQKDYTMPVYDSSLQYCAILDYKTGKPVQILALTNERQEKILYKTFQTDKTHALDIAVIQVKEPDTYLKARAIPFASLNILLAPYYDESVSIKGFPSRTKTYSEFHAVVQPKTIQDLLDKDGNYFYIIKTESDLKGISGAPVFYTPDMKAPSIVGIFVGQNHESGELGYAIYAYYIAEIIRNYK